MEQNRLEHSGTFFKLLWVALLVVTTTNFVWFALTFWAFLTTKSVISTSTMAGLFLVIAMMSGFWFGSIVDHNKKKYAMIGSSIATLLFFTAWLLFFYITPLSVFSSVKNIGLWIFVILLLCGTIVWNIYSIAIPTLIWLLVPEENRAKANWMFWTMIWIAFWITSVASWLVLAYWWMITVLIISVISTIISIIALSLIPIPEKKIIHGIDDGTQNKIDIKWTIKVVKNIPWLFALIFFTTFNNFLGWVFFALMDAYWLSLVSVQVWWILWGLLSFGFILGWLYIAKKWLGVNPLRTLFRNNIITWTVCIFFTIQPSLILLIIWLFIWMFFFPFIEAIEQTILQKVVPEARLGRVLWFAKSVEQSASPITAFFIGPIAQLIFIPFMTTWKGVELIWDWFWTGIGRGIALVFISVGIIWLIITILAMRSNSYKLLSESYMKK